jgi:hypothetical protein
MAGGKWNCQSPAQFAEESSQEYTGRSRKISTDLFFYSSEVIREVIITSFSISYMFISLECSEKTEFFPCILTLL